MPRPNIPIAFLALLFAASLWFIRFGQDLVTDANIPVVLPQSNVTGLPTNLAIKDISSFVLKLTGPSEAVNPFRRDKDITNYITVDLTTAHAGRGNYPLQFGSPLRTIAQTPRQVAVDLEQIITRTVPVKVDLQGKLSDPNSQLDSYPPSEDSVMITAPKSIADQIISARATLDVNQIDPLNPGEQKNIPLVAVDTKGQTYQATINPAKVSIRPVVIPARIHVSAVVSPKIIGTPAPGYIPSGGFKLTPKEIQISGPTSTLVRVGSVNTEPIDVTGLSATKWFTVKLDLPRGITSATKVVRVRYEIIRDPAYKRAKASSSTPPPQTTPSPGVLP